VLLDEAPRIAALAPSGGRLLLSGLLAGYAAAIEDAYTAEGCRAVAWRFPDAFVTVMLLRQ
jgi:ribosomal protein L11 methylase PrmA